MQPIGVFDSGFGGISVLGTLRQVLPNEHFIFYGDSAFAPYGEKSKEAIKERCFAICEHLIERNVKAIVIACNTATSACVKELRAHYDIPIIGMEPALKPAVHGLNNQCVVVMATPFTLKEEKFALLMNRYSENNTIIKLATPKLVRIVENDKLNDLAYVKEVLNDYFKDIDLNKVDAIVLGCTHFVFYKDIIKQIIPNHIKIYDGNLGTALHLKDTLAQLNLLANNQGGYELENSKNDDEMLKLSEKLLSKAMK